MKSAVGHLLSVYRGARPRHVVEIGADTQMKLAAQTASKSVASYVEKASIVAFGRDNESRRGWWKMHRGMGVPVERVDGDARELGKLVRDVDVVYSHAVVYGVDVAHLQAIHDHTTGEGPEWRYLKAASLEVERAVIEEAHEVVGDTGHVIWYAGEESGKLFREIVRSNGRNGSREDVLAMTGEDTGYILSALHSLPCR